MLTTPEYLMLEYAPKFHTGDNEFQQFWKYRYKVDPAQLLADMLKQRLICEDGIKKSIEKCAIPELKGILKENGLPYTGRKDDLVLRLLQELDFEVLNKYFPHRYYTLTDAGKQYKQTLEFNNALSAHRHSIYDIIAEEIPCGMAFNDYAWRQFNNRSRYYYAQKQWGLYSNTRCLMAELLYSEGKFDRAFPYYIEVCICDLAQPYGNDLSSEIAPGILQCLKRTAHKLNYSPEDIYNNIDIAICSLPIPVELANQSDVVAFLTKKTVDPSWLPEEQFCLEVHGL